MSVALFILAVLSIAAFWRRIFPDQAASLFEASLEDRVGEAGIQSFPCSDPPDWTLGVESEAAVKGRR